MKTRAMFGAACIGLTVALAACTSSSGNGPSAGGPPAGRHGMVISVGSFDFPESVLLADIYGQALLRHPDAHADQRRVRPAYHRLPAFS